MLVYHLVYLKVEISFQKDGAAEKGGSGFEIGNIVPLYACK